MSSAANKSSLLNKSDQLMDLSIKNFWIIVHYPHSDPGSEFEILSKHDLAFDSWDVMEKGATVTIKYGNVKLQGVVVTVSDDYEYLSKNFQSIVDEYSIDPQDDRKDSVFQQKCRNRCESRSYRHVIKVTDKYSQTDPATEAEVSEYTDLKRRYDELQTDYNNLKSIVAVVKNELNDAASKLDNPYSNTKSDNEPKSSSMHNTRVCALQSSNSENCCKENLSKMVQIGSGGSKIARPIFNAIKWGNYSAATRKLLITLFPRSILATHSLTGKPSPAFISSNKQTKMRLNPTIIGDIIEIITKKCMVSESLVRNAITTKCADENKMYKKRLEKKQE